MCRVCGEKTLEGKRPFPTDRLVCRKTYLFMTLLTGMLRMVTMTQLSAAVTNATIDICAKIAADIGFA